jgi:gliding motility-associated-like protein
VLILPVLLCSNLIIGQDVSNFKQELIGMSLTEQYEKGYIPESILIPNIPDDSEDIQLLAEDCSESLIPVGPDYTAVPRNDDGSLYIPDIGFEFSFCGSSYSDCYINTNGNISFTQGVSQYSPDGFPYNVPMIAPFWADVDTRNAGCGQAWYKLFSNYMIVTWDSVGWYNQQCSPLNKFQLIISDGTADIIGVGKNVQFRYDEMEWTTGQASGGGPFGGSPATAGYNSGDNVNFEQIGRFNQDNSNYDGPYGNNDGVHYLDYSCFSFNANTNDGAPLQLQCADATMALDVNCSLTLDFLDISSVKFNGCESFDIELDRTDFGCGDEGDHVVTVTVTVGPVTETCTSLVSITADNCGTINIDSEAPVCQSEDPFTLTASPQGGMWSGATQTGVINPENFTPGIYTAIYTNPTACPTTDSIEFEILGSPFVTLSPEDISFCADDNPFQYPIQAQGTGGDNNYTYSWTTPYSQESGPIVFPEESGTYTVVVQDGNSCSDQAEAEVTINPIPTVNINDPGTICQNLEAFQMLASPQGGIFHGSIETPQGIIYPDQNSPGTYLISYTYEDINGCEATEDLLIEIVEAPLALAASNSPICIGNPILLFGNSTSSDPGLNYYWEGPNGFISYDKTPNNATEAGIYSLQIETSDGCLSEFSETEVVITDAPTITTVNGTLGCGANETQIFASTDVSNPDYNWEGPNGFSSTNANPMVMELGTYYVTVSSGANCFSVETAEVVEDSTVPDIDATGNTITCFEPEVQVFVNSTTPNVQYEWCGPNGFKSTEQSPLVSEDGIYSVTAIGPNGCRDTIDVEVILDTEFAVTTAIKDTLSCTISDLQLNFSVDLANVSYEWEGPNSFTSDEATPMISDNGLYYVTVTSDTGCKSFDSIEIAIDTLAPSLQISYNDLDCGNPVSTIKLDNTSNIDQISWAGPNGFTASSDSIEALEIGNYSVEVVYENGCIFTNSINIAGDFNLPEVSAISDTISCSLGSATITGASATPNTEIYWRNDQGEVVGMGNEIMVGSAGIYTCIARNQLSFCEDSVQIEVMQDLNVPDISADGATIDCNSSNFYLEAISQLAVSIEWEGPNGFNSFENNPEVLEPGNYTVTAISDNGCKAVEVVEVIDDTQVPEISLLADSLVCNRNEVIIQTESTGFSDSYQWQGPGGFTSVDQSPLVAELGIYNVTVTSANGCSSSESIEVIQNIEVPSLNASSTNNLSCLEPSTTLSATSNNPNVDYSWVGPGGFISSMPSFNATEAGSYEVTITAPNGCIETAVIDVSANMIFPELTIEGGILDCNNPMIILQTELQNGSNPIYSWTGPNGFISDVADPEITVTGEYTLLVMNDNGCETTSSLYIDEDVNIPITEIDIIGFDCFGSDATLYTNLNDPELNFEWQSESGSIYNGTEIYVQEAGQYTLTVTDNGNGCQFTETAYLEPINPLVDFDYEMIEPGCRNEYGTINIFSVEGGDGSLSFSIDNGNSFQSSPVFENLIPGTYEILVMDENLCEAYDKVTIDELADFSLNTTEFHIVTSGTELELVVESPVPASELESIVWEPAINLSCDDCLNPVFSGYQSALYNVTVVDKNGCSAQAEIEIRVILKDVYIPNAFSPNDDEINDFFTIFGDQNQVETVKWFSIYDRWGNQIFYNEDFPINDPSFGWNGSFNGSKVVPGVYVYAVELQMVNGEVKSYYGDVSIVK